MIVFSKKISSAKRERERESCCTVKRKGFTIIQLVIGMLIFAILTGIAFYGISVYTAQANETRVDSDLGTFEVAIKDYMLNNVAACSDGKLTPEGLNHYLTQENLLVLDESDPDKDDIGSEVSVSAGVGGEVAYKKLSTLKDPWGHQYRVVIRNNADRQDSDGEYGAKGTDRAFIYVYSMGKDGRGAADDEKRDDSVLVVQYSDGEVFSKAYLPSDSKNQSVSAPAYAVWNKDDNGKHSVMDETIFAVGTVDHSATPGGGSSGGGGTSGGSATTGGSFTTRSGIIPHGSVYTIAATGKVLEGNGTNTFPSAPAKEDTYAEGDYVYTYCKDQGDYASSISFGTEWYVEEVKNKTKTSYGKILSEIAGKPVTNMSYTFSGCASLATAPEIPISVTNMHGTFGGCISLTVGPEIPGSVTNMRSTFAYCTSLTTAPKIPGSVTNMDGTFDWCTSLAAAPEIPNSVTNMCGTFSNCFSLVVPPAIPSSVTDMNGTFQNCESLVDAPNTSKATGVTDMSYAFENCPKLTAAPIIPAGVTDMTNTFADCKSLQSAPIIPDSVTDMDRAFWNCESLTTPPVIPDSVVYMYYTFYGCTSLKGEIIVIPMSAEADIDGYIGSWQNGPEWIKRGYQTTDW